MEINRKSIEERLPVNRKLIEKRILAGTMILFTPSPPYHFIRGTQGIRASRDDYFREVSKKKWKRCDGKWA